MTNQINQPYQSGSISELIIGMEKSALDRWYRGDPSGYLEIYADDIVYFDPFSDRRIDGLDQLTEIYESIRGELFVERYELLNPKVQAVENMAVLTFNLVAQTQKPNDRWNCTEVYLRDNQNRWKIIQTHWSFTTPELR